MEIITTHRNTDFDALASAFAASILYPQAIPVLPRTLNPNVNSFLILHKDHFNFLSSWEVDFAAVTRLIVVDTGDWERLDGMDSIRGRPGLAVEIWDHHAEGSISARRVRREKVGAAVTLLVKELEGKKARLTPIQATLFLAGIYEDTGNLTFPSTTSRDAEAVAYLLERRADLEMIRKFLRPIYGPRQKDVLFDMLKSAERRKLGGHTVSIGKVPIQGHTPNLSVVVDMYQDIMNLDAAFGIFSERKGARCIVIGRSDRDSLDIGEVMRCLGGGGHPNAGSAMLKSADPDEVEKWIMDLINGKQKASVRVGDLMSFPVCTVPQNTTMRELASLLRERGCTGIPVVNGEDLVGIISREDFKKIKNESQMDSPVKAYMSTEVITARPESTIHEAVRLMIKNRIGRLPVIGQAGLIGIITRSDAMSYYYDLPPM